MPFIRLALTAFSLTGNDLRKLNTYMSQYDLVSSISHGHVWSGSEHRQSLEQHLSQPRDICRCVHNLGISIQVVWLQPHTQRRHRPVLLNWPCVHPVPSLCINEVPRIDAVACCQKLLCAVKCCRVLSNALQT